jgi:hypothetical protein
MEDPHQMIFINTNAIAQDLSIDSVIIHKVLEDLEVEDMAKEAMDPHIDMEEDTEDTLMME